MPVFFFGAFRPFVVHRPSPARRLQHSKKPSLMEPLLLDEYIDTREPSSKRRQLWPGYNRAPASFNERAQNQLDKPTGLVKIELCCKPQPLEGESLNQVLQRDACPRLICDTGRFAALATGPSIAAIEKRPQSSGLSLRLETWGLSSPQARACSSKLRPWSLSSPQALGEHVGGFMATCLRREVLGQPWAFVCCKWAPTLSSRWAATLLSSWWTASHQTSAWPCIISRSTCFYLKIVSDVNSADCQRELRALQSRPTVKISGAETSRRRTCLGQAWKVHPSRAGLPWRTPAHSVQLDAAAAVAGAIFLSLGLLPSLGFAASHFLRLCTPPVRPC